MEATREQKLEGEEAKSATLTQLLRIEGEGQKEGLKEARRDKPSEGTRTQLMGDNELARGMALGVASDFELAKYTIQSPAGLQTNAWRMELVLWSTAELNARAWQNNYLARLLAQQQAREEQEEES